MLRYPQPINRPSCVGSREFPGWGVASEPVDVVLQAGDEAGVSGDFAVPSAFDRIIVEGFRVGELILELGQELGAGLLVVAVLADVGVGAGFGGEVA